MVNEYASAFSKTAINSDDGSHPPHSGLRGIPQPKARYTRDRASHLTLAAHAHFEDLQKVLVDPRDAAYFASASDRTRCSTRARFGASRRWLPLCRHRSRLCSRGAVLGIAESPLLCQLRECAASCTITLLLLQQGRPFSSFSLPERQSSQSVGLNLLLLLLRQHSRLQTHRKHAQVLTSERTTFRVWEAASAQHKADNTPGRDLVICLSSQPRYALQLTMGHRVRDGTCPCGYTCV